MSDVRIPSSRRRFVQIVAAVDIPEPFDAHELCTRVAEQRRRPIHLRDLEMPADHPCGVCVSATDADFIFYESHTSGLHQDHIIVHEVGHLLAGHTTTAVLPPETSRLLLPNLDPDLVNRVLNRSHYSEEQEWEAEMIASLILERANRWQPEPDWGGPPEIAGLRQRLGTSLERLRRRRPS